MSKLLSSTAGLRNSLWRRPSVNVTRRYASAATSRIPQHLLNTPPTKLSRTNNGIVVATEEWPGETATVGAWINAGSKLENEHNNGVAHFLEHMAFKGTTTRTQSQIDLQMENIGSHLNAYTSREHTVYFAKCLKNHVKDSIEIISDILLNSTYTESKIEAERSTIIREANEVAEDMEEVIFDNLHSAAYQGTSLGRPILGSEANIKAMKQADLKDFVNRFYTGSRMVIVATGSVNHEDVVKEVEKRFANVPSGHNEVNITTQFTGSDIRVRNDDMPLAHVAIAAEGIGWTHPDFYVQSVIQTILGNFDRTSGASTNLSSRLCEVLSTEQLSESLFSFSTVYDKTSVLGNYFVSTPEQVENATYEVLNEWQRIANQVTNTEVERAKNKLKASVLLQLDGTTAVAEDIGRQLLSIGRRLSPAEVWLRISDITAADVKRVARTYMSDISPAVAGIGPIGTLPDYNQIRGWTYWNRL